MGVDVLVYQLTSIFGLFENYCRYCTIDLESTDMDMKKILISSCPLVLAYPFSFFFISKLC